MHGRTQEEAPAATGGKSLFEDKLKPPSFSVPKLGPQRKAKEASPDAGDEAPKEAPKPKVLDVGERQCHVAAPCPMMSALASAHAGGVRRRLSMLSMQGGWPERARPPLTRMLVQGKVTGFSFGKKAKKEEADEEPEPAPKAKASKPATEASTKLPRKLKQVLCALCATLALAVILYTCPDRKHFAFPPTAACTHKRHAGPARQIHPHYVW